MRRGPAVAATAALVFACNDASAPEMPERPLYYLKAPTNSGDRQSDTVLATLPLPFRVLVRRSDTPAPGIEVNWEVDGDRLTGTQSFRAISVTDNAGIATSPFKLTLGSISGTYAVRARVEGVVGPSPIQVFNDIHCREGICFTAIARPGKPQHLRYVAGDGQVATVGEQLPADFIVQSTDAYGNGSPGVVIDWQVIAGGGAVTPTQSTTAPPRGFAFARLTLGPVDDQHQVRATARALPIVPSVTFNATGYSALPVASVTVTPESVSIQEERSIQLSVVLRDANGRLILSRPVTWISRDPAIATVNATGLVRVTSPGSTTVIAISEGVTDSTAVTVTAGPPPVLFASIIAGGDHSCGLRSDGAAYCWGNNDFGELGDGSLTSRLTPVSVSGGYVFTQIVAGADHTCGLTTTGKAYCWGRGDEGQLGNGGTGIAAAPAAVEGGLVFASLGTGYYHTCGVTSAGKAYCWGMNDYGQLGDGTFSTSAIPVAVQSPLSFVALSTGRGWHTCGVTSAGAAYCWGLNLSNQLGSDSPVHSAVPVLVSGELSFSATVTGLYHSCGLTAGAVVQCWGDNHWGELGDGFPGSDRSTPGPVSGSADMRTLTSGLGHTCQASNSGVASCWGLNDAGQLGMGSNSEQLATPVEVWGGYSFVALAGGGGHTCALTTAGVAYCWGFNGSGHLGDGTTTNSPYPVRVVSAAPQLHNVGTSSIRRYDFR
jgi:alpha-tubulin suppressor-like RCC1 family protein